LKKNYFYGKKDPAMPFNLNDLGQNIKRIRESLESRIKPGKPMLQYELARLARIPPSSLSNIEKGKYRNPTWNMISKIAAALGCDVSEFFNRETGTRPASEAALQEMIDMVIKSRLDNILEARLKKPARNKAG
jgi:transcriptional regulator with XRE-family HTH domain